VLQHKMRQTHKITARVQQLYLTRDHQDPVWSSPVYEQVSTMVKTGFMQIKPIATNCVFRLTNIRGMVILEPRCNV
jgi:hypothetical protein